MKRNDTALNREMAWKPSAPLFTNILRWKAIGAYRTTPLPPFPLPKDLFWERLVRKRLNRVVPL